MKDPSTAASGADAHRPDAEGRPRSDGSAATPGPWGTLAPVLIVVAACVVVGLATNGPNYLPASLPLDTGPWRTVVRLAGVALGLAGIVALRRSHFRGRARSASGVEDRPTRGSLGATLKATATIMTVLAVVAILTRPVPPENRRDGPTPTASFGWIELGPTGGESGGIQPESRSRGGTSPYRASESRGRATGSRGSGDARASGGSGAGGLLRTVGGYLGPILFFALVVLLISRIFARRSPRREPEPPTPHPLAPRAATAGLTASLESVLWEKGDPRGQIAAAYHRLLHALAAAGADRRPEEAPHEHLDRALGPLGVRPEPLRRLTSLYVLARFGGRPVTDRHRAQAAEALRTSLSSLRGSS